MIIGSLIAAVILWILARSQRTTLLRLMDGVDDGVVERMTDVIASLPGVLGVGRVRARWSGHRLEADADVAVDCGLTVLQSHAWPRRWSTGCCTRSPTSSTSSSASAWSSRHGLTDLHG